MKLTTSTSNILFFIIICIIIIVIAFFIFTYLKNEGFENPLDSARIRYEDMGKKMYNEFSDTQDWFNINGTIPLDGTGNALLNGALDTGTYEGSGAKTERGSTMDIQFNNPRKFKQLPVDEYTPNLGDRVRLCESVKSWDCDAFKTPEFKQYCGICIKGGSDSQGHKFDMGGLYIDPFLKKFTQDDAEKAGKEPEYTPSVGNCLASNFVLERPDCDYRRDRWQCSQAQSISDPVVVEKCLSCLRPSNNMPTYIYSGKRGNAESGYAQEAKPYKFTAILRLVVSFEGVKISLKRNDDNSIIPGKQTENPFEYTFTILNTYENETFVLTVEYPSFEPYSFTSDDNDAIADMVSNDTSSLSDKDKNIAAATKLCESNRSRKYNTDKTDALLYGCGNSSKCCKKIASDPSRVFAIVGQYESSINSMRRQAFDTSITNINGLLVNFDIGPPRYGDVRKSPIFKKTVPANNTSNLDSNMMWTWAKDNTLPKCVFNIVMPVTFKEPTFPADAKICPRGPLVSTQEAETRLRAGACEKLINGRTQGPGTYTDACIRSIFLESGCKKEGLGYPNTPELISDLSYKKVPGKVEPADVIAFMNNNMAIIKKKFAPWSDNWPADYAAKSYAEAAGRGAGETWAKEIQDTILTPSNLTFTPPSIISRADPLLDEDINNAVLMVKEVADKQYKRGDDLHKLRDANMYCYGKFDFNPCAGPNEATGPHTMECLDFLFKNSGKNLADVGPTYRQSSDRSSGTDRIPEKPIMYCTRKGKLSPLDEKGNVNMDSVQRANSQGGVTEVRKFYDSIHKEANYSLDKETQYRAMFDCYGLTYTKSGACPEGESALDDPTKIPDGAEFKLVPSLSPGSKVVNLDGAVISQSNIPQESIKNAIFVSKGLVDNDQGHIYILTKSGPPAGGYLVIDGFKVKLKKFEDTFDFKQRATWNVINSVAGNPGEVSIESVSKPGFYIFYNKVDRSINISNDKSDTGKPAMSFAVM